MYRSPGPLELPPAPWGVRRWFWPQSHDWARLHRELDAFRVELALLESAGQKSEESWAKAAHDLSNCVAQKLQAKDDVEGGWVCLHAARRHAIHGLGPHDLATQASVLRAEAGKFVSWRAQEMRNLLAVNDDELTATRVINAMALRDEYFSNQYHKIWLMGQQLATLLVSCGLGLLLFAPLVIFFSLHPDGSPPPWGYQMIAAVLFFGVLGAAFSAAGSILNSASEAKVPERVANQIVTSARALLGGGVGLAGYVFYESKVFDVHVGTNVGPGAALTVAFLFGFAGEQLISRVLGSLGKP